MEYSKIQTLFKRDNAGIIIPTEFTYPEFEFMKDCKFRGELKVDGTNTRIIVMPSSPYNKAFIEFKGRTDRAIIPEPLQIELNRLFNEEKVINYFDNSENDFNEPIIIYGEGYGKKIQSCGSKYCKDHAKFIVFDIKIGEWWLNRESIEQICKDLNITENQMYKRNAKLNIHRPKKLFQKQEISNKKYKFDLIKQEWIAN